MARRLNVLERRFEGPLAQRLTAAASNMGITLYWLGQAGFVIQAGARRLIIDPYLSDTLAEKYEGTATPHKRMARPPVDPAGLGRVDLVLITHHHTDHMDPGTLLPLAQLHPDLRFVVPRASRAEALKRTGATNDRLIPVDAGQLIEPWPGLSIVALRAAHETLETDIDGNQPFLGYALTFREEGRDVSIIHSGDTIRRAGCRIPPHAAGFAPVARQWTLGSACRSRHRRQSDARRGGDADRRERSAGDDRPSLPAFRLQHSPRRRHRAEGS